MLASHPQDRDALLSALRLVSALRADIDALERATIDAARSCGASWATIASALGLSSRQAAEQRRLRLDDPTQGRDVELSRRSRDRQRSVDTTFGDAITEMRLAMAALRNTMEADAEWDARGPTAALARRTALIAVNAEPGTLFDLARLISGDLSAPGILAGLVPAASEAATRVRDLLALVPRDNNAREG